MIAIPIPEVRPFMNHLLCRETFDAFQVPELTLTTHSTFTIDGHIHKDYFSNEEYEEQYGNEWPLVRWKQLRPFCFGLIRGKHTPLSFSIVLQMPRSDMAVFLSGLDTAFTIQDIHGLFLNLRYGDGSLTATTGTSMKLFSLDRSVESAWDKKMQKFIFSL